MMRSLYSGVAGLKTHQTKMDVIGNNIANVNTTSFKSQSITFSDLMYQTTQTASGATETKGGINARQIGLGAKSGAINTAIEGQGATQTTNNPFDIMITGKAFFVVNNGNENLYTRDGSFYVDGAGNLAMQSNGYFVMGWAAQEDPETGEITVNKNGGLTNLQIMSADNSTYSPASTTAALYSGNIDDHDTNVISDDGKTITLEFYDNKGYLYTGKFTLKDTGTDHLFSLELTSIIDSMGKALPAKLMEGITFGKTTSKDELETSAYSVKVSGNTATVNLKAGAVKYEGIPSTGTLSELMTTGKGTYAGVLQDVFGITDDDVINGIKTTNPTTGETTTAPPYGKTAEYTLTEAGLTISYTIAPQSLTNKGRINDYGYTTTNTNPYFVNKSDNSAYRAPASAGSAEDLKSATLKNVFSPAISDADIEKYTDSANGYLYTYSNKELVIYKDSDLEKAETKTDIDKDTLTPFGTEFTKADGTTLSAYLAGDGADATGFQYTFKDGTLNLYKKYTEVSPTEYTQNSYLNTTSALTSINGLTKDTVTNIDAAATTAIKDAIGIDCATYSPAITKYKYTEPTADTFTLTLYDASGNQIISTGSSVSVVVVDPTALDTLYGTINTAEKDVADYKTELAQILGKTEAEVLELGETFNLVDLTGSQGVIFKNYKKYPKTETTPVTFNVEKNTYTADSSLTETAKYKTVYARKDGSAYVLDEKEDGYTLSDIPDALLQDVYGLNKDDIVGSVTGKTAKDFDVTFSSGGSISISYSDSATPKISEDYELGTDNSTDPATYFFKTAQDITEYSDVPLEGNIRDLVSTADGPYRGILTKAFGVSDEEADAYGSDGKYKISDGTITLTTGTHTIQLMFDPATGALVSANGDPNDRTAKNNGLVNMTFINNDSVNYPGLEAFGFQPSNADEEERRGQITFDFSTVTNYNTSGSSTIKAVKGDKSSLNTGRAVGEMNGVTVSTDGQIYATYSNGQTKLLGQIASAEFANASGLSKEGDNLYKSTLNSGEATIQDITTDGGYMSTGVLEMSNVDLSSQFTEMITTQRGFQANSRIITVSDTLLEELTNLKR